jgi:hypothetical protein
MCLLKLYRKYFVPAVLLELKRSLEENIRKDIAKQIDIYSAISLQCNQWRNRRSNAIEMLWSEEFEDTKGVIRIRKSKKKTTQWPKEKGQRTNNDLQNIHMCSGWVGSSCSSSGTRRANQVTSPAISHEWGKDRKVFTSGTYPWSFVTQIFRISCAPCISGVTFSCTIKVKGLGSQMT